MGLAGGLSRAAPVEGAGSGAALGQSEHWVPGFQIHVTESSGDRGLCSHSAFWSVRWEGSWGHCLPLATGSACPPPQACGVDYEVKAFCAENLEEKIHKRYTGRWWERGGRTTREVKGAEMRREGSRSLSGHGELPGGGSLRGLSQTFLTSLPLPALLLQTAAF